MRPIREIWKANLARLVGVDPNGRVQHGRLKELAAKGISPRSVQHALEGHIPQEANLSSLAEALGVHEAELFQDPEYGAHKLRLLERVAALNDDEAKLLLPGFEALLSGLSTDQNDLESHQEDDEPSEQEDSG